MKASKVAFSAAIAMALAGCAQTPGTPQVSEARIAELEKRIESVNASAIQNGLDVADLKTRFSMLENASTKAAIIDPASNEGYQMMSTAVGPLLVSLVKVTPLADGSQLTVQIGNPHAVSLQGMDLNVRYGKRLAGDMGWDAWNEGLLHKQASIAQPLYSGSWNTVLVSLPGIAPDDLGFLSFTGEINRVALTTR